MHMSNSLSVLMVSPGKNVHGGVSFMAETIKKYARHSIITSFYVGSDRKENTLFQTVRLCIMTMRFIHCVLSKKYDVVHLNPSLNYKSLLRDGWLLFILYLLRRKNTLIYFHGWDTNVAHSITKSTFGRFITCWLLSKASLIAVLSPDFAAWLINMRVKEAKIRVTTTLFDADDIICPPSKEKKTTILFMSRLEKQKGIYELLEAFSLILPEYPEIQLIYAGAGSEMETLRQYVKQQEMVNKVIFPGYVTDTAKAQLLADATVFAFPTYYPEGMPIALLEAMAAGKPLLTTKAGGMQYVLSDPENGIILEQVDVVSIVAGLRKLLQDTEYCQRTGEYNKNYAWQHYEASKVTQQVEGWYNAIAAE